MKILTMHSKIQMQILVTFDLIWPLYDVILGVKIPENDFFQPKSSIFWPISMKLGRSVKNMDTFFFEWAKWKCLKSCFLPLLLNFYLFFLKLFVWTTTIIKNLCFQFYLHRAMSWAHMIERSFLLLVVPTSNLL